MDDNLDNIEINLDEMSEDSINLANLGAWSAFRMSLDDLIALSRKTSKPVTKKEFTALFKAGGAVLLEAMSKDKDKPQN